MNETSRSSNRVGVEHDLRISEATYEWSVRLFRILQKLLKVNVKLHHEQGQIAQGDIFLFNHFARFETFIPQYLIYTETGAFSRSVAAGEFFERDDAFSNYLLNAGAVPSNLPNLLPFLGAEILRGRKVIVFPEGGMVKDRRVLDTHGRYSIYSRKSMERRKHHTGAAVLGLALDAFKGAVLRLHREGDHRRLEGWAEALELDGAPALLAISRRPTRIVPANITFYPIRVNDNLLRKGAELLNRGISRRLSEELLIEGNILLEHTDMDVRLGDPIHPERYWTWLDRKLLDRLATRIDSLEAWFALAPDRGDWGKRVLARRMRRQVLRVRDRYMQEIYADVTVNLSHLASHLVLELLDRERTSIAHAEFHRMLYLAVKHVQREPSVHLHRSLRNPEWYAGLLDAECEGLAQFIKTASTTGLIDPSDGRYAFLPKLEQEHTFDEIRLENLVTVYANEVAPLAEVRRSVDAAFHGAEAMGVYELARHRFADELLQHSWDRARFAQPRHGAINEAETATADASPFLLESSIDKELGVLLVHGFLASPAEMAEFGRMLHAMGHTVLGMRLKGHGTSPWDLRERSFEEWLASVERGYQILRGITERVLIVGFSTGGALALRFAAEGPPHLSGVAAVAVPIKFRNKNMMLVPLVHRANRLLGWASSDEGLLPFRAHDSEHPAINYRHMPIRGLYELRRMVVDLESNLTNVDCPVLLLQGTEDPVVVPRSASIIYDRLRTQMKSLRRIESTRHGILHDDVGETRRLLVEFLNAGRTGPANGSPVARSTRSPAI